MAKKSNKSSAAVKRDFGESLPRLVSRLWLPFLLAAIAFVIYLPSLGSDFVYDARVEILEEGFIPSLANLPAVLTGKVLGMNLLLADRPGQMLYLMINAAIWGKQPWGYHLCSNLLHSINVALLFILLRRLVTTERGVWPKSDQLKIDLGAATFSLIFALHPITVEAVSGIGYSSDILVVFFTLLALLAATFFSAENSPTSWLLGGMSVLFAVASVTCKESGLAAAFLLVVYWFLFRRNESKTPWILLLSISLITTALFLAARFLLAFSSNEHLDYLGGSFSQAIWIQPRLWVFMMGKLAWPLHLSADYTLENLAPVSTPVALAILALVLFGQGWLWRQSRMGALGVAVYWLGLITVSNFIPLNRMLADRFYYLSITGLMMQLFALFILALRWRPASWIILLPLLLTLIPLTTFTLQREFVFTNELTLWSDTVKISPFSSTAYNNFGTALYDRGRVDESIIQFQKVLKLEPNHINAHNNLGLALFKKDHIDEAITEYRKALALNPSYANAYNNLGWALVKKGVLDDAILYLHKALEINPHLIKAHNNLGVAYFQKNEISQSMTEYNKVIEIDPTYAEAYYNIGIALVSQGRIEEAIVNYQKAIEINPDYSDAHYNLGTTFLRQGRVDEAIFQFQKTLEIDPKYLLAHNNLGIALAQKGLYVEAIDQFQETLNLDPTNEDALANLAKARTLTGTGVGPK